MVKDSIKVGSVQLKNRIVMPPIATYRSTEDGQITDDLLAYYGARAVGGCIGMIETEHSYICLQGKAKDRQLSIACDDDIEGLKLLTDTIRRDGTRAVAQLNHAGSATFTAVTGQKLVSASSIPLPVIPVMGDGTAPEEMTEKQIEEVVNAFVNAARRAKAAGYDGVEIHSAHAYLLNQFYCPLTNHRTDAYGGSLENRLRFHREVIKAVREEVGADYLISVRLGGCDYRDGGSTIEDSVYAAQVLEKAGADMISVSGGMCRYTRDGHKEAGYFSDMSAEIRKGISIPVMLTGGITTAEEAERLLEEGAADLIGVGRELMRNPRWAQESLYS